MCCPTTTRTDLWSSGGDTDPVCSRSPILGPKPPPPPPSNTGNPGDPIAINFQPPTMAVPEGYIKDSGALFGDRGNGYRYGWSCDLEALGDYRDRDGASTRESSLVIPDRSQNCDTETWDIELPNGDYSVVIGYSDPSYNTAVDGCVLEDASAATGIGSDLHGDSDGSRQASEALVMAGVAVEHVTEVTVTDGSLTFDGEWGSADGRHCQSISYMLIQPAREIIMINFQPPTMIVPEGYLKDSGALFGDRGNGYSYGWSCDLEALGDYRDREDAQGSRS